MIDADPHQFLAVARRDGRVVGTLQLTSDVSRGDAHRFHERLGYTASRVGFKKRLD